MVSKQISETFLTLEVPGDKVVVFRFSGGPRDGQDLRSDGLPSAKHRIHEAHLYWLATSHGEVGRQFTCLLPREMEISMAEGPGQAGQASSRPFRKYRYAVIDKKESQTDVVVQCQYLGSLWMKALPKVDGHDAGDTPKSKSRLQAAKPSLRDQRRNSTG